MEFLKQSFKSISLVYYVMLLFIGLFTFKYFIVGYVVAIVLTVLFNAAYFKATSQFIFSPFQWSSVWTQKKK